MAKSKIIIVGGGASGMAAAIIAARQGAKVTLLERMDRVGKKILATGNGRCNLTNVHAALPYYHSDGEHGVMVEEVMKQFGVADTLEFFRQLGITTIEKEDGKRYPRSEQAASVVIVLLQELQRLKVEMLCDETVTGIEYDGQFKVTTQNRKYYGNKLILAGGGKSCPDLGSNGSLYALATGLGHKLIEPLPSLIQLRTDYPYLKQIQGTKVNGMVRILDEQNNCLREEYGEILFADYGVSGPPILQISRHGAKRLAQGLKSFVTLDIANDYTKEALDKYLAERFATLGAKTMADALIGFLNNRLIGPILKDAAIDPNKKATDLTKIERQALVFKLKETRMQVTGTHQWNQSQVTAGGIAIEDLDPVTLESKRMPNLYICGELMDIDGDCGGYNLQWAFSSGAVVGKWASEA